MMKVNRSLKMGICSVRKMDSVRYHRKLFSSREVDPSTWNQPIHPSQYTRSDDGDDDDDTTEGK